MRWTAESLSQLATGYWSAQALMTAVSVGLFEALPATTQEACEAAGLDHRTGGMLMEALGAMGILVRGERGWEMEGACEGLLRRDSPTSLAAALAMNAGMAALWGKLPDVVKTGQPAMPPGSHLGADPQRTRGFVMAMESRGRALLPPVAEGIDLREVGTLLDVGSGAGTLGRMLVERHGALRVTLLDLPGVTEVAAGLTKAHPHRGRVTHLAADYLNAPLPGPFDVVLSCGALHQHDPDQARQLMSRLAGSAAEKGGRVVVVDLMAGTGLPGGFSELFALNMALVSRVARVHSPEEVRGYMAGAGLEVLHDRPAAHALGGVAMYHMVEGIRA